MYRKVISFIILVTLTICGVVPAAAAETEIPLAAEESVILDETVLNDENAAEIDLEDLVSADEEAIPAEAVESAEEVLQETVDEDPVVSLQESKPIIKENVTLEGQQIYYLEPFSKKEPDITFSQAGVMKLVSVQRPVEYGDGDGFYKVGWWALEPMKCGKVTVYFNPSDSCKKYHSLCPDPNTRLVLNIDIQLKRKVYGFNSQKSYMKVMWVMDQGIMNGTFNAQKTETTFEAKAYTTRKDAATVLWKAAGSVKPKRDGSKYFKDVTKSKVLGWIYEQGIAGGYSDKTFRPDERVRIDDFLLMIWKYSGKPKPEWRKVKNTKVLGQMIYTNKNGHRTSDIILDKHAAKYRQALEWAFCKGLCNIKEKNTMVKRMDMAFIIYNLLN